MGVVVFVCGCQFDVATGNQSIGDELLALGRDSEALQCFGKCVEDFKMLRGENNALVASAYTCLADLFLRTNNPKEARAHCQHALHIYAKQAVGHVPSDVAYGLVDIASILVELNEKDTALLLLKRAFNIQDRMPGTHSPSNHSIILSIAIAILVPCHGDCSHVLCACAQGSNRRWRDWRCKSGFCSTRCANSKRR